MRKRGISINGSVVIFVFMFILLGSTISDADQHSAEQKRMNIEESVRKAAVQCYAIEGVYPPGIEYLKEHYGLLVDDQQYFVYYEIFAENIMPEVTVFQKQ